MPKRTADEARALKQRWFRKQQRKRRDKEFAKQRERREGLAA
jgi:hypothetical protein